MSEDYNLIQERYDLTVERIAAIPQEHTVPEPFDDFFGKTASFLLMLHHADVHKERSLEEWQAFNRQLYEDILPENYGSSYGNPAFSVEKLGEVHGRILSFLYSELRGIIVYKFEDRLEEITILHELFIEIYNCFEEEELPAYREIQQIVYWWVSDYSDLTVSRRIREAVDPSLDFATRIIMEEDLTDLRYLYRYGEYITENEIQTARHLNSLPQETIDLMADTYTEGYRIGFVLGNKDLSKKKTVNIRYNLGFERMIRAAVRNFEKMGLKPVIYRAAVASVNRRGQHRIGYFGAIPNKQYDYDHRADSAIYLDKMFAERKAGVMRTAYEEYKELAYVHAGPACVETFGEDPFVPVNQPEAYHLSEKQQQIQVNLDNEASRITNCYIKGEERSFTIIAFPVPEIGEDFPAIFDEVIKINTLDYTLYRDIQQSIIDTLDQGEAVHILGCGENHTDLTVQLHRLEQPEKQTNFENCVADVNIPVGEVFTSPVLKGTNGVLEVSEVYLNELRYENLHMEFEDGMVKAYTCGNFDSEEENQRYIRENVLYHHDALPLGEFAIGTNTTAYAVAKKYDIAGRLPILIAEKMGPHFAVGDTCYSWAEDTAVFNPDGKEIIARDNEVSIQRKSDISKAYLGCHTDITIPYDELGKIEVICKDGRRISIIENGRFVLKGTEELNRPLEEKE
ncbi:MAG: aminopeptidase [Hominisplanchenecus sp.]|nr:aminopeptidase [Lachnospiraceae bacterium]